MSTEQWPAHPRDRTGISNVRPVLFPPAVLEERSVIERASLTPYVGVMAPAAPSRSAPGRTTAAVHDTAPLVSAARAYLSSLAATEVEAGRFPMNDTSWRQWANPALYLLRHGLCLDDLDPDKRDAVLSLMRASLSDGGMRTVTDCMHLNRTTGEMRGELDQLNEWLYWFSLYGDPQEAGAWGWQLDGHHVNVNCAIVGGRLVLTPTFLGAEPVAAFAGRYAGTWALQPEQDRGSELYTSLTDSQRAAATIGTEMPPDLFTGAGRDNFELRYEGLCCAEFSDPQIELALALVAVYVGRARSDQANSKMREVRDHLAETYFAWIGEPNPRGVFYYRVHSPVILIEFEHTRGTMFDNDYPARNHIHTIVRTPNGNDYGKDYLREHHQHAHAH